jgi:hypothetical protein
MHAERKVLVEVFYRFYTTFKLFEDKQRAKFGGVDTYQMYIFLQVLFSMIFFRFSPNLNRTAESNVAFFYVGNKFGEKYHASFPTKQGI